MNGGGYDDGYAACQCFWGSETASLIRELEKYKASFAGLDVLDAGCGEGKNAVFFAERGCTVRAVDISTLAIAHAVELSPHSHITWECADIRRVELIAQSYDIVLAYGLLHCLENEVEITSCLNSLKNVTKLGGFILLAAFNDRSQDLGLAHPRFSPSLMSHSRFLALLNDWELLFHSDLDLKESHPNNGIEHSHSMTRILARRPANA